MFVQLIRGNLFVPSTPLAEQGYIKSMCNEANMIPSFILGSLAFHFFKGQLCLSDCLQFIKSTNFACQSSPKLLLLLLYVLVLSTEHFYLNVHSDHGDLIIKRWIFNKNMYKGWYNNILIPRHNMHEWCETFNAFCALIVSLITLVGM